MDDDLKRHFIIYNDQSRELNYIKIIKEILDELGVDEALRVVAWGKQYAIDKKNIKNIGHVVRSNNEG